MTTGRNVKNHGLVGSSFHHPTLQDSCSYRTSANSIESLCLEYASVGVQQVTIERCADRSPVLQRVGGEAVVYVNVTVDISDSINGDDTLEYLTSGTSYEYLDIE
ncbi:hypothetical protein TcWFU_002826 [Taenia crassiceps]|uniref:Uncharacterized protein n=1 Tax=Taenia crassiceps TaxID=6207 RepID=A0ABR4QB52_9CEST